MEHTPDPRRPCQRDHRPRVILGVACVYHKRLPYSCCQLDLRRERGALLLARRIVVVIVEAALADRDRTGCSELFDEGDVAGSVKTPGVVGMNAGGCKNEIRIGLGDLLCSGGRAKRLADADNSLRARGAGASDYRVAVAVEGRVREVGVAVEEDDRPSILRGHFRSIHRRIGAAT